MLLLELLRTILLTLCVWILRLADSLLLLSGLCTVGNYQLLLVLCALPMNLRQPSILLKLELFGIVAIKDMLNARSWLRTTILCGIVCVHEEAGGLASCRGILRLSSSVLSHLLLLKLLLLLALLLFFIVARCGLGPGVHHLNLFETATHHSIVWILIRATITQSERTYM